MLEIKDSKERKIGIVHSCTYIATVNVSACTCVTEFVCVVTVL